jgi:hypothetical protein
MTQSFKALAVSGALCAVAGVGVLLLAWRSGTGVISHLQWAILFWFGAVLPLAGTWHLLREIRKYEVSARVYWLAAWPGVLTTLLTLWALTLLGTALAR